MSCSKRSLPVCFIDKQSAIFMKVIGILVVVWWLVQVCGILYYSDNSRISKGRYFIRYSYEVEVIIFIAILINRVGFNMLYDRITHIKILINFGIMVVLMFEVKWGDGIVHPLTKKYFTLFCLLPFWFSLSQILLVITGRVMSYAFLITLISYSLFLPVYLFKEDELDLNLVALQRPETIDNPAKLLFKLNSLLVLMREESLGDEKYSILLEGVIREFQEYSSGEEVELLNNFTKKQVKDKNNFFKIRQNSLLRLISLYFMKGISRHTDFAELKFSFVYFMFDFLGLKNQSIQFLLELGGYDMKGEELFKWIIVKNEIEADMLREEEENKKDKSMLNKTNQKIKYDLLAEELEKIIIKIMELWKVVSEENTKIRAIRDQLLKVTNSLNQLNIFWKQEERYFDSIPKCQILYGLFLKECINETEKGDDLIKKALEEIESRKQIHLNFSDLDSNSNFQDLEKAVAFITITKKPINSFIENCTVTFAKYLGTQKRNLVGTMLWEYVPKEIVQNFIDIAMKKCKEEPSGSKIPLNQSNQKFPFLTYHGRMLKEFFMEYRLLLDQTGQSMLALNLTMDNDFQTIKFLMNRETLGLKYCNAGMLQ